MPWSKPLDEPIMLSDGRELHTLRDAVRYITELPKAEHDSVKWQLAMESLMLVAETDAPEMRACIAVMKALNRHQPNAAPAPRQNPAKGPFGSSGDRGGSDLKGDVPLVS